MLLEKRAQIPVSLGETARAVDRDAIIGSARNRAVETRCHAVLVDERDGSRVVDERGCPQRLNGNSLVRMSPLLRKASVATVLVDAPSDYPGEEGLAGFRMAAALHLHGAADGLDVGEGAIRIADGIKRLPRPPQFRPKLPPGLWNCFQSRASRNETTSFWRSSTVSADFLTIPKDNPTNLHLWKRLRLASRRRSNGCFSS